MMSKILKSFWIILDNLPRLKESIYKFYAWRIFEIVPWFKKIIYKFYDKFWYLELSIDSKNQDLSKNLPNEFTIDIKRLNYYIDYKIYLKNKNLNIDKNWDNSSNLNKIEESNEFILLKEHFLNKKKWKEIDLYHILNDQLTQYKKIIENSGGNQFVELLNSLDKLLANSFISFWLVRCLRGPLRAAVDRSPMAGRAPHRGRTGLFGGVSRCELPARSRSF